LRVDEIRDKAGDGNVKNYSAAQLIFLSTAAALLALLSLLRAKLNEKLQRGKAMMMKKGKEVRW